QLRSGDRAEIARHHLDTEKQDSEPRKGVHEQFDRVHESPGRRRRYSRGLLRLYDSQVAGLSRSMPSCVTLATSVPARSKICPRANPRLPPDHGLSVL